MSDPFKDAVGGYIKADDLKGRHLLITPIRQGQRKSTQKGAAPDATYTWVECHVVVLDGEPGDKIDELPFELEAFQFTGSEITIELSAMVGKKNSDGTPKMKIGKLGQAPSQQGMPKWTLEKSSDEAKQKARTWLAAHPPQQAEDPFAS